MVNQQVACDAREPDAEGALVRTERANGPEDPEKHVLGQILGFGVLATEAVAECIDAPGVGANQALPGGLVALQAP